MSNKTLFQEAIADAKAVREAALANAKAALEEALTPRLQSMIATRLEENYDELEEVDLFKNQDHTSDNGRRQYIKASAMSEAELDATDTLYTDEGEPNDESGTEQGYSKTYLGKKVVKNEPGMSDPYIDEDLDLSEILAELEAEGQLEEAKKKKEDEETEDEKTEDEEAEDEEAPEEGDEEEAEPTKVKDMTDEELIDLIKDIVQQEMEAEEAEMPAEEAGEPEHGAEMNQMSMEPAQGNEEEININELLAELDEMDNDDKEEPVMKEYLSGQEDMISLGTEVLKNFPVIAQKLGNDAYQIGSAVVGIATLATPVAVGLLAKLTGAAKDAVQTLLDKAKGKKAAPAPAIAEDLNEAITTIGVLRNELNEVNLLNAKLLYVNKIFKSKSLTESQKVHVIASFDKATTIKEAKIVFESLNTALSAPKKQIKESLGFASRAAGIAPRQQQIVESNDAITRMQKLANIIK